ncbi:cupin domain-containing protein [Sphingomonas sp.]|uniref:cupin domain-containing protein n=1 Tax=Sphingomonas sp. TaxID=28214 RepID=UPI0035B2C297
MLSLLLVAAVAQSADPPAAVADSAEIRTAVAEMAAEMREGQGFHYRPLLRDGRTVAALEYWKAPGRPAVHPAEAEYAVVIEGAGTLVSGGTMTEPRETRPGLVEGARIEGGATRALHPGDVILVPAGVPHWFGVTGGKLVLLGMKVPLPANGVVP